MKTGSSLNDWCKWLEKNFSPEVMIPLLPVIIRFDGVRFSKWTKKLNKPFDEGFSNLMIEATKMLVQETNAVIGYTQSDEITLILYSNNRKSEIYHNGKKQKIVSKLTSKLTYFFNKNREIMLPNNKMEANFDCRVYQTPTLNDAALQLLWRENDASRNSKQMAAYIAFSSNEILNKNTDELQEMLYTRKGINWNDYDVKFKRGTYIKRFETERPLTNEELESLPEKHNAKKDPNFKVKRSVISKIEMPIFNKIQNRVGVVFLGEAPILKSEENENIDNL